jgi:hypothetical protein
VIPTRIKVGRTWYDVKQAKMPPGILGEWRYKHTVKNYTGIRIATGDSFGEYTDDSMEEAFWHELTHAILHSIGEKKLNDNEEFVTKFSICLHKAIKSAEFK